MAAKTTLAGQIQVLDRNQYDQPWDSYSRLELAWPKKAKITWKSAMKVACERYPEGVSFYWRHKRLAYLEGVFTAMCALAERE